MQIRGRKVAILGTGAYGTALAQQIASNGHYVQMYGIDVTQVKEIQFHHSNRKYFPDVELDSKISATTELDLTLHQAEFVVFSVPSKALKALLVKTLAQLTSPTLLVNVAKGFNRQERLLWSETFERESRFNHQVQGYVGLFGPSLAKELILGMPGCLVSCSKSRVYAEQIKALIANARIGVQVSSAVVAAELSAILKNVVAIGSGVLSGLTASENARASLVTLGYVEMQRLIAEWLNHRAPKEMKRESPVNVATLGDLVLTASTISSRNFSFGRALIEKSRTDCVELLKANTVEGVEACEVAQELIREFSISLPLFTLIYEIVFGERRPEDLLTLFSIQ